MKTHLPLLRSAFKIQTKAPPKKERLDRFTFPSAFNECAPLPLLQSARILLLLKPDPRASFLSENLQCDSFLLSTLGSLFTN